MGTCTQCCILADCCRHKVLIECKASLGELRKRSPSNEVANEHVVFGIVIAGCAMSIVMMWYNRDDSECYYCCLGRDCNLTDTYDTALGLSKLGAALKIAAARMKTFKMKAQAGPYNPTISSDSNEDSEFVRTSGLCVESEVKGLGMKLLTTVSKVCACTR